MMSGRLKNKNNRQKLYMMERAEKLRQLYVECQENFENQESTVGNPVSPFDLPNFDDIMPKMDDSEKQYDITLV